MPQRPRNLVRCVALDLASRSIRTLAWLGDAFFEIEVRRRLSIRGDYPTDRLDAMKAEVVCAPCQAQLLAELESELDDDEAGVVRRGRNTDVGGKARGKVDVRTHRSATALEALVAYWLTDDERRARFETLLVPKLEAAIDLAVQRRAKKPRRGR